MSGGVFKRTVFKPTVFKTDAAPPPPVVGPTFYSGTFYNLTFNTDTPTPPPPPPPVANAIFDTHDGYTERDVKRYRENTKRVQKLIDDAAKEKRAKESKRKETIKEIIDPSPKVVEKRVEAPVKVEEPIVTAEQIKEAKDKEQKTLKARGDMLDRISDKRHLLSLIKIVYELDDYDFDSTEVNLQSSDEDIAAVLERLNTDYKNINNSL